MFEPAKFSFTGRCPYMAKVLVIEDDELARESVSLILEESGHDVIQADDGDVGIQRMQREECDVVVTDIIMPTVDGLGVLAEIKLHHPRTRVIAISGGGRLTPLSWLDVAKKLGADEVLAKPFSAKDLNSCMQLVLG
jgi:CheY-like chemotaxis protein